MTPTKRVCIRHLCTIFALIALLGSVGPLAAQSESPAPHRLKANSETNPVGLDDPAPRLSWILNDGRRGAAQSAYQVLVASSLDKLAQNTGDLWNSGRVNSDESVQIAYRGQPLKSSQKVFWKVRVWDQSTNASAWSQPASWTMGLLAPEDWLARWITHPPANKPQFDGASWIWHAEAGSSPLTTPKGATRWFQHHFDMPSGREVRRAFLMAAMDNAGEAWLNGERLGDVPAWEQATIIDVTSHLRPGSNLLAIRATNGGNSPNPAGILAKLFVELNNGTKLAIVSDSSWKSTERVSDEAWKTRPADEWKPVTVVTTWGGEPWKKGVRTAFNTGLPLFRKDFEITKPVRRAVVHVCGLGHYDLFLDGRKVGDRFLDPAWSVYEKTAFYSSFDITEVLKPGTHAFGVMLGKGFYNTAGDRRVHGVNADRPLKLILQAHVFFADGSEQTIVTDPSWRTSEGPITHSAILGGEDFDARKLPAGWEQPGFNADSWAAAVESPGPGGTLVAAQAPPMKMHDVFKHARIDEPQPGIFVYDFGQNASAIPRLRVRGQAGQTLKLTPAEQRHGMSPRRNDGRGLVNPAGVGTPNYFRYTLRGGTEEQWTPQFTYSGFQFLQLEGAVPAGCPNPDGKPVVEELLSVHVRNDAPAVGSFACSNPLFNDTDRIIDWAVRANMAHVLTDCPHREKLGWLEVSYLMGPSIAGRYDIARFYSKITRDCADSQRADGQVPTVAPAYPAFAGGFAYTPEWGAAAVVNPWLLYQWYGDRAALQGSYSTMKRFVDYLRDTAMGLVPVPGLGDWYDYGHGKPVGPSQFTPIELSAMATFHRCARIVADTAAVLGRNDDQQHYTKLAAQIATAFNTRYFDGTGEYKNLGSPQCANSMALVTGMVPTDRASAVCERIINDIRQRGNQQTAGDIGYWYLLQSLAQNGRSDVIFDIVARTNLGSYGFIVHNGWTSMPEAWDANTGASMNHCMLGHIQEWFMSWVAGIQPDPAGPGFKKIILRPSVVGDLTWAKAHHDCGYGRIASAWQRNGTRLAWDIAIPPNTTATVFVPAKERASVRDTAGVTFLRMDGATAVFTVPSGTYHFESMLPEN